MTGLEALMWRLGRRHPSLVPWMGLRVGLDRPVRRADVARRLEEVTAMVPRLRDRVAEPPLPGLPPRWEPDPAFDVQRHLRSGAAAEPPGDGHPPWCAALVDGRTLDLLMHHSYTDGLGAMRLLSELFDGPFSSPPPPPAQAAGAVEELAARSLRTLGKAFTWAAEALSEPTSGLLAAVTSQLGGALAPASPIMRARSGGRHFSWLSVELRRLKEAGRRLEATVNDVFLSALLEGLARYHEKNTVSPPSTLRLGVPVSSRPGEVVDMANQLHAAVLAAPLGCADFDERTRLLHEMVGRARAAAASTAGLADLLDEVAGVASGLPGADRLAAAVIGRLDVVASNVAGPPSLLRFCGSQVTELVPCGPRAGAAVNATLLSYAGTAFVGLNVDPAAVARPEELCDCLRAAFDAVPG